MAKVYKHSDDAVVKQLAIFETPPTNTSVREKRFLNVHPVCAITKNTSVIHFTIKGDNLKYLDLNSSRLYVRCRIEDMNGNPPDIPDPNSDTVPDMVVPVNHLLQSMWKQVEVYWGGKLVTPGSTDFPYKSMIKTLLYKCGSDGAKKQMCPELFYEDTFGEHDSFTAQNYGLNFRWKCTGYGLGFDMEGPINEDSFQLDKYLVNGVDFDLKLYPAASPFVLMSSNPNRMFKLIIEDAVFKCQNVDVGGAIISAHTTSLKEGGLAQYFFNQCQLYSTTVSKGLRNISECIFRGKIPHKIVVAFVGVDAYNGSYSRNPFNFQHYYAKSLSVLVNDVSVPHRPFELDFNRNQFAAPLCNLMRTSPNVVIDGRSFDKGYSLFVFDLDPNQNDNELSLQNSGTVRVECQFEHDLPECIQMLAYAEYESCIQVDNSRATIYTPL